MPLIGKAIRLSSSFIFDFDLTISGTTYHFNAKSESSSVTDKYKYVRGDKTFDLIIYASGSITFNKLKCLVDYSVAGGGGGGGGGYANSATSVANWGYGGGGNYGHRNDKRGKAFDLETYSLTVGAGGKGGGAGLGSGYAGSGGSGGNTYIKKNDTTVISASGGQGGYAGSNTSSYDPGHPSGGGDTKRHFESDDTIYPTAGYGGGGGAAYAAPGGTQTAAAGYRGGNGSIVIRSAR